MLFVKFCVIQTRLLRSLLLYSLIHYSSGEVLIIYLDLFQELGVPMNVNARLQINMRLLPLKNFR